MSTYDSNLDILKLNNIDETGHINYTLKFTYNDDGTATLEHPKCVNRKVVFDQTVVNNYLKPIEGKQKEYIFDCLEKVWLICPKLFSNRYSADNVINLVSGDMIDDGQKIICTNPIHLTT